MIKKMKTGVQVGTMLHMNSNHVVFLFFQKTYYMVKNAYYMVI